MTEVMTTEEQTAWKNLEEALADNPRMVLDIEGKSQYLRTSVNGAPYQIKITENIDIYESWLTEEGEPCDDTSLMGNYRLFIDGEWQDRHCVWCTQDDLTFPMEKAYFLWYKGELVSKFIFFNGHRETELSVDGVRTRLIDFIEINKSVDVEPISDEEIDLVLNLQVGETCIIEMVDVRRIK